MLSKTQRRAAKVVGFCVFAIVFLFIGDTGRVLAFDAGQAFTKKCSSCHTVGGGDGVGPDLKDVKNRRSEAWLVKFITSSESMVASGDAVAVDLFNKYNKKYMPDQDLSENEIKAIVDFIQSGGVAPASADIKSALDATPQDIKAGEDLFVGRVPFEKGGPSCVSCHSAGIVGLLGGGTLARDLTSSYSTYKDKGLSLALKNIAFPVMREIFSERPLTDDEIFKIKSFLYKSDQSGQAHQGYQKKFLFLGLGGVVLALGGIDFIWRRRRKYAVKNSRGGRS